MSVALVGAREDGRTVGGAVARHLLDGFGGRLSFVNRNRDAIHGHPAFRDLATLDHTPDLVVIATPARTVADLVESSARLGAGAAVILSAVLDLPPAVLQRISAIARSTGLRILGPNSLGILRPSIGLNASFSLPPVQSGTVGLVTQSGGMASALLDWAAADGVGFSSVISLGNQTDVGFADALDFLTDDPRTESIVMYLEGVREPRRFVSALRAAARIKPVIALKGGREAAGARAAVTHTGAMSGPDDAFDAVLRRCGVVRARDFLSLFATAKYLSSRYRVSGRRLAIVTNGGGPGVLAVDRAIETGLDIAPLARGTVRAIDAAMPARWSRDNPVDVMEDADPVRYQAAVDTCLADASVDGVVAIVTPQTMTEPDALAASLVAAAGRTSKPLIACFMGVKSMMGPLAACQAARLPAFRAPEPAVEAFANLADFYANQKLLMQVPGPLGTDDEDVPDVEAARAIIDEALKRRRTALSSAEARAVLGAFRIPIAPVVVARTPVEAIAAAQQLGAAVALKVNSPDVSHKSDAGGVRLGLRTAHEIRAAFAAIERDVRAVAPHARLDGVTVEAMIDSPHPRELLVGVLRDPVFGPVITFGAGGRDAELIADRAVALPPLNAMLADGLVRGTRVSGTLDAWRGWPAADRGAVERVLLRVSELVCELPSIDGLDINPLVVDEHGARVADARITIAPATAGTGLERYSHMAICPYPTHLTQTWNLPDGRQIVVRPIRPEDAEFEQAFVRDLSEESRYFRFANALHELSERMLVRFTQIDYDRELALVALAVDGQETRQIGVARYVIGTDDTTCEFALVVADAWQGKGIGRRLMQALMDAAAARNLTTIVGYVLGHNSRMLHLMTRLGFDNRTDPEDNGMRIVARRLGTTAQERDTAGRKPLA
ncbi:MAG: bifunctional acetate--CoA ligase family protein/GNAT family N-acetyltransferase [Burkholderiales bacterium]